MRSIGRWARAMVTALLPCAAATSAAAQDPGLSGQWRITKVEIAPWADLDQKGGEAEAKRLSGKIVVFGPHSIRGPAPLACRRTAYVRHADTPDLLFEGELAESQAGGKLRDPAVLARTLGMTTTTVWTFETGCAEMALHRFAPDTLVFGLNNRIYTLRPIPKPPR